MVIVGGGTAGITVAARLRRAKNPPEVAIIEPSTKHYYQPLWTLVGAGVFPPEASVRDEATTSRRAPRGSRIVWWRSTRTTIGCRPPAAGPSNTTTWC
nr:FAD/NAD(P)-binding oxidoreductase [Rhodothermus marinus]